MDRRKLAAACVLAAAILIIPYVVLPETPAGQYTYVPSNITDANPKLQMPIGHVDMRTEKISETKDTVILTVSGTVTSVGDPIVWEYKGGTYGSVPVTINVDKKTKDETGLKLDRGDSFTFYLHGLYEYGRHYVLPSEPQFEIGEHVLVHIGKADQGPDGKYGDNYFVVLLEFGKYRIHEGRAYNEKYSEGRPLNDAFNEAI